MRVAYVVTMYRYGDKENHSYLLGVYDDEELAVSEAQIEQTYRGGNKYYPEVMRCEINLPRNNAVVLELPMRKEEGKDAVDLAYCSERSEGVPCVNMKCLYRDIKMTQNCGIGLGEDEPFLIICTEYKPKPKTRTVRRPLKYLTWHEFKIFCSQNDCKKNKCALKRKDGGCNYYAPTTDNPVVEFEMEEEF